MLFDIPNPDGAQGYDLSFANTPNNAHAVVVCWDEMIRDTTEPNDFHFRDSRLERNVVVEIVRLGRLGMFRRARRLAARFIRVGRLV